MNIAIVDDRPEDREGLARVLKRYAERRGLEFQIEAFASGEAFSAGAFAGRYALIFLDVYMGDGMNGVRTAELIRRQDEQALLVFLTTSREHQAEAIHWHVYDYLNKDGMEEKVEALLNRILRRRAEEQKKLSFTTEKIPVSIPYDRLVCITADRNYLMIRDAAGSEYRTRTTFSGILEELGKDARFLQVLRGVIVNMDYLVDIADGACTLKGNIRLPVNIRNASRLERIWTSYTFEKIRQQSREENEDAR